MINTKKIKNIIFDFGGVILNLDQSMLVNCMLSKGLDEACLFNDPQFMEVIFGKLERGIIPPQLAYDRIRSALGKELPNEDIAECWNSVLKEIPEGRIDCIREVKNNYNIYLLSNTNQIHYDYFLHEFRNKTGLNEFDELFKDAYFSHEIHLAKPNPEIFEYVMAHSNLKPEETIFIDDLLENALAAHSTGIQAVHLDLTKEHDIRDLFQSGLFRPTIDYNRKLYKALDEYKQF
ncbi:MAG: HAD family hydrolase [Bacteroidales bacterium]